MIKIYFVCVLKFQRINFTKSKGNGERLGQWRREYLAAQMVRAQDLTTRRENWIVTPVSYSTYSQGHRLGHVSDSPCRREIWTLQRRFPSADRKCLVQMVAQEIVVSISQRLDEV